jgi:hypothetical protein
MYGQFAAGSASQRSAQDGSRKAIRREFLAIERWVTGL